MRLKSYFSETVEGAMAQARQELGADAMLMNSSPSPAEARHLGEYEVVFATELPAERAASNPGEGVHPLAAEIAEMKKELESMRCALRRSMYAASPRQGRSLRFTDAYAALAEAEVTPELAREIVEAAESRLTAPQHAQSTMRSRAPLSPAGGEFETALAQEIEARLTAEPVLGAGDGTPRIVALVGPPGAGKTTTLVKLAVNYGLVGRRPVLLLSFDTVRVAAAEQLRSYAAILGVGFQLAETVGALSQAIEENRGKELILIDTPGLGTADLEESSGLARFLSTRSDIDTQLVLPASMKQADLARMVDLFEQFRPRRLLFTKLDETGSFGPLLNEAVRASRPLSFFATGQRVPEDLEAATPARLAGLLLAGRPGLECPAA